MTPSDRPAGEATRAWPDTGADALVRIRDARDGRLLTTYKGHPVALSCVGFSPQNRTLVSAGMDGTVKVWDPATAGGPAAVRFGGGVAALAFSADGRQVAAVDGAGLLKVAATDTGAERARLQLPVPLGRVRYATLSDDARTVALCGLLDDSVSLFDVATGKLRQRWKPPTRGEAVTALAFSPDGRTVAVALGIAQKPGRVVLWDPASGAARPLRGGHRGRVKQLAFSPDGRRLATACADRTLRLWDDLAGEPRSFSHPSEVACAAFSRDGRRLAAADAAGVAVRDVTTGRQTATIREAQLNVGFLAFSPDGRRLATVNGGDVVGMPNTLRGEGLKLWDLATGTEVLSVGGGGDTLTCVAFSRDGRRLATGHALGGAGAQVFNTQAGGELRILEATPADP
jgi:WD40 repeat protein